MKENRQGFLSRRNHKISKLVKQVLKFSSAWRKSPQDFFDKLSIPHFCLLGKYFCWRRKF